MNCDESTDDFTINEFYLLEVLPNILLWADREETSVTAYAGEEILEKSEDPDVEKLLRLHEEFSARRFDDRNSCIYITSLEIEIPKPPMRVDTQPQYIMNISDYFKAFRETMATTLSELRTRPLTVDEIIERITGLPLPVLQINQNSNWLL